MENLLSYYKIFYTIYKTQNLSLAAKELYISQPAISKALKNLENHLNTALFIRSVKGVKPTYEGELLFRQIEIAFHAIEEGEKELKNLTESEGGAIRIGASTTLCKYILLPFLKDFMKMYPKVKISIQCQSSVETITLLESGKIDIGLIGKPEQRKNFDYLYVEEIEDIFVSTPSYLETVLELPKNSLSNKNTPTLPKPLDSPSKMLEKSALLLLNQENITRKYQDRLLEKNGIENSNIIEVTSMDLLIDFAKTNLGIACVIKNFVEKELEHFEFVELRNLKSIPTREVGFVYHKESLRSKALLHFVDYFREKGPTF